ncbi:MAG TPA: GNAT family N-acetyltransferase [Xanthobacteraceae bacterium]|nr:GNAT family N-acetyltransferase [Xanthobacteraceae bacterium]
MSALQMTCGEASCVPAKDTAGALVLETDRLILREPRLAEAAEIAALANNRKIAEMTALIPHPYAVEDAMQWISSVPAETRHWKFGVFTEAHGFVGACGFTARDEAMTIGYWIGEPYWGRGYATEAARAVIDHIFSTTDLDGIAASCRVTNPASRRVLEKCGFQWTGVGLLRIRSIEASTPVDQFKLERRTWASLRAWGQSNLPKVASARP